jgi:hypothetical protein
MEDKSRKRSRTLYSSGERSRSPSPPRSPSPELHSPPPSPALRPRTSSDPSVLSPMAEGPPPKPNTTLAPLPKKSSARLENKKKAKFSELTGLASALGSNTVDDKSTDLTPFLLKPLDPGNDGRGYVSTETRREMERAIKDKKRKVASLDKADLPAPLLNLLASEQATSDGYVHVSGRSRADSFTSGEDHTLTLNTGRQSIDKRVATDTPPPRSPNPYNTDDAIVPGLRYEQSHQSAYRFTREPGTTVFAPTQANQVADSVHERHAAKNDGGWVYRHDTYTTTRMISAKPVKGGGFVIKDSFYRRRKDPDNKDDNSNS